MKFFSVLLFVLVPFPQINGDLGASQIPSATAAAQAQAAAVAAAQQHRQFEATQGASVQPQNSSPQAAPMTSPPLQSNMSPHLPMPGQVSPAQQVQTSQPSAVPLPKQQVPSQMSPSGQRMTPPQSQGKTPPRESGKNLAMATQAQSPASQGDQGNSSGYGSGTDSGLCAPNVQPQLPLVKTEPASPPSTNSQTGKVGHPMVAKQPLVKTQA